MKSRFFRCVALPLAALFLPSLAAAADPAINEIRIDQSGSDNDEYVELFGTPNAALEALTYLVIGDGPGGSGVIEAVVALSGQALDGDGLFVVAEGTFTLGTADLTADLNFENSDNVTHLLVAGFTGDLLDDLDTDDDGVLDITPWSQIVDSVALVEADPGDWIYSGTTVGPDGTFVPGHVFRIPDGTGTFEIGAFDPVGGDDTPGQLNDAPTPRVAATDPADGATGVSTDIDVTVTFSEAVEVADIWAQLTCGNQVQAVGSGLAVSGGPSVYTLSPATALPVGTACTLDIFAANVAAQDDGAHMNADVQIGFTTELLTSGCGTGGTTLISDIQGSPTDASWPTTPMQGMSVSIEAIVVGDFQGDTGMQGFFIQEEDADADADPQTSEGLFVYDPDTGIGDVNPGDRVRVTGAVGEFNHNTQVTLSTGEVCASGNLLPAPTTLFLPEAVEGDLEFNEGMQVIIATSEADDAMTVAQNFFLSRYGQLTLSSPDDEDVPGRLFNPTNQFRPQTPDALDLAASNVRRLLILDDAFEVNRFGDNPNPVPFLGPAGSHIVLRAGDVVNGLQGILDQGRINSGQGADTGIDYRLQPTAEPIFFAGNERPSEPQDVGSSLKVASFNVLNYFNGDGLGGGFPTSRGASTLSEFERQSDKIVAALAILDADIVGLMEIENDGYGPESAIRELVDRLNAEVGAGTYTFIDPGVAQIGTDEIAVGFLYKPARVTPVGDAAILDNRVGIRTIDTKSRPPLAQTFAEVGSSEVLTVIVNHFKSKGSDCGNPTEPGEILDPDTGDGQDSCNLTRISIAQALLDWLEGDPTASGDPDFLIIGDLNAYAKEDPVIALTDPSFDPPDPTDEPGKFPAKPNALFTNLISALAGSGAYSYVFDGLAGYLDHALANPTLLPQVTGAGEWHINTDEPPVLDYNEEFNPPGYYDPDPYRSSDHDPVVIGIDLTSGGVPGDLNGDGRVDRLDWKLLRGALGTSEGDPGYLPEADFNQDGRINVQDTVIWLGFWRDFRG